MGTKFIRNTDDATIVCRITSDKNKIFNFRAKKFDKRNNIVLSNGFTEVTDEDIELLAAESKTYNSYIRLGKLSIVDSLPQESMSVEQLIITLKNENASLKKELSKKVELLDSSAMVDTLKATVAQLSEEINELRESLEEKNKMIAALDLQIAGKTSKKNNNKEAEKE